MDTAKIKNYILIVLLLLMQIALLLTLYLRFQQYMVH